MNQKRIYPQRYFTGNAIVVRPQRGRSNTVVLGILIFLILLLVFGVSQWQ